MAPPVPHVAAMSAHHGSGSGPVSAVAAAKANPHAFASHQKRHQHRHQQPQASQARSYTLTALGRWSVQNKQLPPVEAIKAIHVYDFDNTLFKTPTPNPKLWNGPTIGLLANPDCFVNGGWWHDNRILAATGAGLLKEEARAWEGWWNESIVELVRLSHQQKDALCVLLTGRSEHGFGDLVARMVASKGLDFDMMGLKPATGPDGERFASTMAFKQVFLRHIMETYRLAEEIHIYEDRPKHVKGFRDFMVEYNLAVNAALAGSGSASAATTRAAPINAHVFHVLELGTHLDPVIEVAEVQHLLNAHNAQVAKGLLGPGSRARAAGKLAIKKTVFYTGYLIDAADTQRLLSLMPPARSSEPELKIHANNIMICPRPCPASILDKVGGLGAKVRWEVTGTGCLEGSVWAAAVRPVPSTAKYHTDNKTPHVVLALRKGARPIDASKIHNWQPVPPDKAFSFETTVGEKILFRIEAEDPTEGEYESMFANKSSKRKHTFDDEAPSHLRGGANGGGHHPGGGRGYHAQSGNNGFSRGGGRGGNNLRGNHNPNRGYRTSSRGGGGYSGLKGSGGRGGGRGGKYGYHSLDDVGKRDSNQAMSYEDSGYSTPNSNPHENQQHETQHQHQPASGQQQSRKQRNRQSQQNRQQQQQQQSQAPPQQQHQQQYQHQQLPALPIPPPPLIAGAPFYPPFAQGPPMWMPPTGPSAMGGQGGGYAPPPPGPDMHNHY